MDLYWRAPRSVLGAVLGVALVTVAATLAIAVAGPGIARASGTCTDSWKSAVNGDWSEAAKWSTGAVPTSSDEVCITVAGTYTVTAESSSSSLYVKSLTVEPASGGATLSLRGLGCTTTTYFNASANITTGTLGTIQLTNAKGSCSEGEDADLSWGGTFANAGKITVAAGTAGGTRELEGNLTNTGNISIGVNTSSNSEVLENKGSITVATKAILSSSSGTITNGTGGSVTDTGTGALEVRSGVFNQGAGAAGKVYVYDSTLNLLGAGAGTFALEGSSSLSGNVSAAQAVVIQGVGCISGAYVTASAGFTNAGSIELTNVEGTCAEPESARLEWSGTLTNTGKITVAAGTAGGTRELDGNLTNTGKISIGVNTSSNSLIENKGSITVANEAILSSSSATFTNGTGGSVTDTGTGALEVDSGIFNQGAGAAGKVYVYDSTLNLLGAGAGTFAFEGTGSLSGNVSAAQSVVIEGFGCYGGAAVTASAGFTNAGSIDLTNTEEVCAESEPASLSWPGTLTNTGTITSEFGSAGGSRTLDGNLTNSGAVDIDSDTSFDESGAVFTNKKTVTVADEATLSIAGGQTFTDATGGSVTTTSGGSLDFSDTIFNVGAGSPGSAPVLLEGGSKLNLTGATEAGKFVFRGSDTISGNVAAGQSLVLQSVGCAGRAEVTAPTAAGFTNAGSIELTNVRGSCAGSQPAQLTWSGAMTNTGTITSNFGSAGGTRTLDGTLTNSGAVDIDSDTSFEGSGALFTNKKTVTVADGATLSTPSGQTFTDATGGSLMTTSGGSLDFYDTTFNVGPGSPGSAPVLLEGGSKLNLASTTEAGTFVFRGSGTISGNVAAAQSVVLQSVGCAGGAYVTAPASAGFTNAGSIELTNVKGTCTESEPSQLEWSGPMTNTGTITSNFGSAGGTRTLDGTLTNSGAVDIDSDTSFEGSGALFTNKKTVTVADGATLSTPGGQTFTDATGGSLTTTSGSLDFNDTTFNVGAGSPGSAPVLLEDSSELNLTGATAAGTFVFRGSGGTISGNVAAAQSVVLQGVGCGGGAYVTASAGFTNAGSIELTNVRGSCAGSQTANLEWSGTLTNTGTITSNSGSAGGTRTLNGTLTNSATGAVNINAGTSFTGSQLTNSGTLTLGAGRTLSLTSGTFTQGSGGNLVENVASASSFGKLLNPSGSDSLAGKLTLDTASGYSPPRATKFRFMTFGSKTGTFASNVFNGHTYSVKYDPADVTLSALDTTTTTVALSSSSTQVGNAVTATATVTGPAPGNPTGTIAFSGGSGAFTPAGTCTLVATGTAGVSECSVTYTPTAVETGNMIAASYPGDGNYAKSSGSSVPLTVTTRTTATAIACTPAGVAVGVASACTATVTDTNAGTVSTPTGSVKFTTSGSGSFAPASSCTLAEVSAGVASCTVSYTPSAVGAGTHTIGAGYEGDATHAPSGESTPVTVTTRTTTTTLECTPASVAVGVASACTATVTDTSGGAVTIPTGSVKFTTSGSGSFAPASSCTLAEVSAGVASCTVSYTPSAIGTGTPTITGAYAPGLTDTVHAASTGHTLLTVTKRTTATAVSCSPGSVATGVATSCTATVTDTSGGTVTTPTGSVKFTTSGTGSFAPASSCTLAEVSAGVASCTVSYTPSAIGTGTHKITAGYAGNATHATSSESTSVTVT